MSQTSKLEIKEAYLDYTPPVNATVIVDRLLRTVPDKYLVGLDCVVLTNEAALPRRNRRGRAWSRKRKVDRTHIAGRYHGGAAHPYIELRVDKIFGGLGHVAIRVPFLRNVVFGHVLFHEVGHHIHRTIRPEFKERKTLRISGPES